MRHPTHYRTTRVNGLSIFYREAGSKDAPTLLLLHGLTSSSRMFESLLARLSDRYHLVAPDYPGFGHSDWPDPKQFAYTFDHCAEITNGFTEALGLSRYTRYMQDYGGPVGFRMALAFPDRVEALIVQNAVTHNEGLGAPWKPPRAFWADRATHESTLRANLLSLQATRIRYSFSRQSIKASVSKGFLSRQMAPVADASTSRSGSVRPVIMMTGTVEPRDVKKRFSSNPLLPGI